MTGRRDAAEKPGQRLGFFVFTPGHCHVAICRELRFVGTRQMDCPGGVRPWRAVLLPLRKPYLHDDVNHRYRGLSMIEREEMAPDELGRMTERRTRIRCCRL